MKTLLTLLLLAAISSAEARINETLTQCVQRYGKPVAADATSATWVKEGIQIKAVFTDEICDWISYEKPANGLNETFSDVEIETLHAANFNGQWVRELSIANDEWRAEDNSMTCVYQAFTRIVEFKTRGRLVREKLEAEAKAQAERAAKKAKLKGF